MGAEPENSFKGVPTARKKMYLAVLWICERVFDADSGNDIHISLK